MNDSSTCNDNNINNYKIIRLKHKSNLHSSEIKAIDYINKFFNQDNFYIEVNPGSVKIYLKKLDMKKLGRLIKEINDTSPFLLKIYRTIKNIKSYVIENNKRVYVDYNREKKVKNRKKKERNRQKYFYARNHNFNVINQPLPEKYINKIICGDSEQILKEIPDNSIDLILTSPPYNFGLDYKDSRDGYYWKSYFSKLFSIFKECIRILKYGGRIIINVQPLFSDYIPTHHLISNFFIKNKMIWKGEILWEKNNYNCKYTAWGSWKSPSSPYLKYTWEFLEIFAKGSLKKKGDKKNIDITGEEFKEWVSARWSIAPVRNMKKYQHPAVFPEELVYRVLKLFSYKGDVILDPFNGTGTTTAVAHRLKRNYLGIDISPDYCNTARGRLNP
ncbi:DNA-methyltransferase [Halothermothrix orenii]|uniref:Methyltransferase n=1 Tax=Halothermothrix orenii (strain H 168 / OCM 544 / DSM 9562) TaxID=373903 RepID=B8D242_HALOH|nr:site-specific DNA-methyltransferase [Halothermothrix orenii]ACL69269.1 DNA methylase N-4/N-6 domain protein [Halothermothrix orenii H 168]